MLDCAAVHEGAHERAKSSSTHICGFMVTVEICCCIQQRRSDEGNNKRRVMYEVMCPVSSYFYAVASCKPRFLALRLSWGSGQLASAGHVILSHIVVLHRKPASFSFEHLNVQRSMLDSKARSRQGFVLAQFHTILYREDLSLCNVQLATFPRRRHHLQRANAHHERHRAVRIIPHGCSLDYFLYIADPAIFLKDLLWSIFHLIGLASTRRFRLELF